MNRLIVGMTLGEEFGVKTVEGDLNPDTPNGLAVIVGKLRDYVVVGDETWQVKITQYPYGVEASTWGEIDDATVRKLAQADKRLDGLIRSGLEVFVRDEDISEEEADCALDLRERLERAIRAETHRRG